MWESAHIDGCSEWARVKVGIHVFVMEDGFGYCEVMRL